MIFPKNGDPWILVFERETRPFFIYESVHKGLFGSFDLLLTYSDKLVRTFIKENEYKKRFYEFSKRLQKEPQILKDYKTNTLALYNEAVEWSKTVKRKEKEVLALSREDLLPLVEKLHEYYEKIGQTILVYHYEAEDILMRKLREIADSEVDVWYMLTEITSPIEPSKVLEEEMKLLEFTAKVRDRVLKRVAAYLYEIEEKMKKGFFEPSFASYPMFYKTNIEKVIRKSLEEDEYIIEEIKKHAFDFSWLGAEYGRKSPLTYKDFLEKMFNYLIKGMPEIELKAISMHASRIRSVREKAFRICNEKYPDFKKQYEIYANLISMNAEVRIARRMTYTQLDHYSRPILERIVKIYNELYPKEPIDMDQIYSALLDEIINFLEKGQKLNRDKLQGREEYWVCEIQKETGIKELIKEDARNYEKTLIQKGEIEAPPAMPKFPLKGKPRIHGKERMIEGPVRVVVKSEDLRKISEGDILVTLMVLPSYIEYFGKIKGIITQEGTLTCHALTLVQELAWKYGVIPLVTDVPWITRILKDDMRIKVDTWTGEISLIDRR